MLGHKTQEVSGGGKRCHSLLEFWFELMQVTTVIAISLSFYNLIKKQIFEGTASLYLQKSLWRSL